MDDNNVIPMPTRRDRTSWTEINTRRQCPHKHKLHYIDGWRPAEIARPLAIGIMWHEVMELHYASLRASGRNRKVDLEPIVEYFKLHGAKDPDHPEHEVAAVVLWMYDGYRKKYGTDPVWEFIDVGGIEEEFRVPIPGTDLTLIGRIDLVVRWNRRLLWVVDHKANKTLPYEKDLDLDDQMPLYIWGLRQHYDLPIAGAMFNVAKTYQLKREMTLEERFDRFPTYRTDHELEVVVQEAAETIRSAYGPHASYERHPDPQNCKWRCQFVEPCLGGRKADHLEEQLLRSHGFTQPGREGA